MLLCQGAIAIIVAITFSGFLRKDKLDRKEIKKIADEENLITKTIWNNRLQQNHSSLTLSGASTLTGHKQNPVHRSKTLTAVWIINYRPCKLRVFLSLRGFLFYENNFIHLQTNVISSFRIKWFYICKIFIKIPLLYKLCYLSLHTHDKINAWFIPKMLLSVCLLRSCTYLFY